MPSSGLTVCSWALASILFFFVLGFVGPTPGSTIKGGGGGAPCFLLSPTSQASWRAALPSFGLPWLLWRLNRPLAHWVLGTGAHALVHYSSELPFSSPPAPARETDTPAAGTKRHSQHTPQNPDEGVTQARELAFVVGTQGQWKHVLDL